jgi:hypothetical protein
MTAREIGLETLVEALLQQGFHKTDEFGLHMTYERANDALKVHVGFDGSFAAFDSYDELVAEGKGMQDLYAILVSKTVIKPSRRSVSRHEAQRRRRPDVLANRL